MSAPDGNNEEERNQREFVTDIEEDHVARQEGEHDGRFHEQELRVEAALSLGDGGEAHQHAARNQYRGQDDEKHANGVGTKPEFNAEGREEFPTLFVWPEGAGGPRWEFKCKQRCCCQDHQAGDEANCLGGAFAHAEAEDGADEWQDDQKDGECHEAPPESQTQTTHATISPIPPAMVSA